MTWDAFHHRGDVLRAVVEAANRRRDGRLPTDVPGIDAAFADDLDLVGALQLRWHTRLAGRIERAMTEQPLDLESAVVLAWRRTAAELPGVRAVIDAYGEQPTDPGMAAALRVARTKERVFLAAMAGRASASDPAAVRAGARIEEQARAALLPIRSASRDSERRPRGRTWLRRIKAALPAA